MKQARTHTHTNIRCELNSCQLESAATTAMVVMCAPSVRLFFNRNSRWHILCEHFNRKWIRIGWGRFGSNDFILFTFWRFGFGFVSVYCVSGDDDFVLSLFFFYFFVLLCRSSSDFIHIFFFFLFSLITCAFRLFRLFARNNVFMSGGFRSKINE